MRPRHAIHIAYVMTQLSSSPDAKLSADSCAFFACDRKRVRVCEGDMQRDIIGGRRKVPDTEQATGPENSASLPQHSLQDTASAAVNPVDRERPEQNS